jgi:UDP-GlcNAc:undecaprenyl-phosphate/decaprenyl-phosphate GlcNAc-1-phosphate transferase
MEVIMSAQGYQALVHFFWCFVPAFFVSASIGWWVVPYCIGLARVRNIFDVPDGSGLKSQKTPVPYLGGMAVLVATFSALAVLMPASYNITLMCVGSLLLALLGLADDLKPLTPSAKFFGQALIALCFIKGGLFAKQLFLSHLAMPWIPFVIAACSWFWIVIIINSCNVIDVMDGLCTTTALGICCNLLVSAWITQSYEALLVLGSLMGALIAFLAFNKEPAQIYLGDSGSLFVGGLLAIIPFIISWQQSGVYFGMLSGISAFAIPISEVGGLVVSRLLAGISWYKGSRHHFCHYLQTAHWSIRQILILVTVYSLILCFLSMLFLAKMLYIKAYISLLILVEVVWIYIVYGKYVIFAIQGPFKGQKQR